MGVVVVPDRFETGVPLTLQSVIRRPTACGTSLVWSLVRGDRQAGAVYFLSGTVAAPGTALEAMLHALGVDPKAVPPEHTLCGRKVWGAIAYGANAAEVVSVRAEQPEPEPEARPKARKR